MNSMSSLLFLTFFAAACIAIQAAINVQFGQIFNNSLLTTSYAFLTNLVWTAFITVLSALNRQASISKGLLVHLINVPNKCQSIYGCRLYLALLA
jgi:uncharacterized membrane protein YdcZ (DUF606 family)